MSSIEPVRKRDPRVPVSPQLALRVAIIGGVAMVLFGVIFFRLWYLQVLSSEQYVAQADANRVRELPIAAPRGQILDREGQAIVGSTVTNAVQIVPDELPPGIGSQVAEYQRSLDAVEAVRRTAVARLSGYEAALGGVRHKTHAQRRELDRLRRATGPPRVPVPALPRADERLQQLFKRLGGVLRVSPRTIDERVVEGMTATPYAQVTIKTDAGRGPLTVIGERASEFPGVAQEPVSIREYPDGEMAAQILGYVGQVSEDELKLPAFRGVKAGTIVGKAGLEYYYFLIAQHPAVRPRGAGDGLRQAGGVRPRHDGVPGDNTRFVHRHPEHPIGQGLGDRLSWILEVEDEVAQAVDDRAALVGLGPLRDMRVAADNGGGPRVDQRGRACAGPRSAWARIGRPSEGRGSPRRPWRGLCGCPRLPSALRARRAPACWGRPRLRGNRCRCRPGVRSADLCAAAAAARGRRPRRDRLRGCVAP